MLGCLTFLNHVLMCSHFSFFSFGGFDVFDVFDVLSFCEHLIYKYY